MKKMQKSYFKHRFNGMNHVNFIVGIVHHLISRQFQSTDNTCMKFNIGGNAAKFTKNEFSIIMRLKMGSLPTEKPQSSSIRLLNNYFNSDDKITNLILKDIFK